MAKLSARGAHVVAKFKAPDRGSTFAIRSDGWILWKPGVPGSSWKLYLRLVNVDAARKYAEREGWQEYGGYASGRVAVASWEVR